jgi:hypothetical protein
MTENEIDNVALGANGPTAVSAAREQVEIAESPPAPAQTLAPEMPPGPPAESDLADKLRAEFGEVAAIAAQALRLGVTVDAADAMRKGISADSLRRSVLDTLTSRAEATSVIAAPPSTPVAGDSAIVRRAKQRAVAAQA